MKITVNGMTIDLKVGADPEVFVTKKNKLVSAYNMVPGTKESPYVVPKGAIQVDGMALEFNIDPAESEEVFLENIKTVMSELSSRIPKDHNLHIIPTAMFGKSYIASQPLIARELGCSSDLNAYTGRKNPKPDAGVPFRTASGHIHIGWTEGQDIENPEFLGLCCDFTKVLDLYLGVPSVLLDSDTKRRSLYGAAGAFRAKTYGLEYRVLSNFWLKSDCYTRWVYKQTEKAITEFLGGFRITDKNVTSIINNSIPKRAKGLIDLYSLEMPNA